MTFDSGIVLAAAILISILNGLLMCIVAYKPLQIFQQRGYKVFYYVEWLIGNRRNSFIGRLFMLTFIAFAGMAVLNIPVHRFTTIPYLSLLGILFYVGITALFCLIVFSQKTKIPLKFTPRIKRQYVVIFILSTFLTFFLLWIGSVVIGSWLFFSLIAFTPFLLPYVIILTKYILWPLEFVIRLYYINKAKTKLADPTYDNLIRIGITGSYGKTTCKNILAAMLSQKFSVAASPASFNTPMGFAKTVNEVLAPEHEIMVFEMGLRYKRDIKTLAELFKPQHGILTAIGSQHIETMGSIEAIKAEKSELVNAVPQGGIVILNGDSEKCVEVFNESSHENKHLSKVLSTCRGKLPGCTGNYFATATDIKVTKDGCTFKMNLGSESINCTTKLLGIHSVENILMCATMAFKLGVTKEQIANAISTMDAVPHRLELIEAPTGVLILDDSYNASEQGTRAALKVLELFDGKKIVQTPGIVEQGKQAYTTNFNYAKEIAGIADAVIVVNEINRQAILDGLASSDFDKEKIHTVKNLEEAKALYATLLSSGDVLLIANDLPDSFT